MSLYEILDIYKGFISYIGMDFFADFDLHKINTSNKKNIVRSKQTQGVVYLKHERKFRGKFAKYASVFMLAIINAEFLLWMYDELYFFNFCIFPSRPAIAR